MVPGALSLFWVYFSFYVISSRPAGWPALNVAALMNGTEKRERYEESLSDLFIFSPPLDLIFPFLNLFKNLITDFLGSYVS